MSTTPMIGFKTFKSAFRAALSRIGFNVFNDIACLNEAELGFQIIISGNDYFLGIYVQLTMPIASREIESAYGKIGFKKKLKIGQIYTPLLTIDITNTIISKIPNAPQAILDLDWNSLTGLADTIADKIGIVFDPSNDEKGFLKSQEWPLSLSPEQAAILSVGSYRIGGAEFLEEMYNITHEKLEVIFDDDYLVQALNACIASLEIR